MFNILRHKSKIGFDKVYCISYCRNIEKQKNISKIMKYLGIDFTFIYGADYSNLEILKHEDFHFKYACDEEYKFSAFKHYAHFIGASYDHYTAVIHAYESGANSVLIMEDDILFIDDKKRIYKCLNNYPKDANMVKFGYWCWNDVYNFNKSFFEQLKINSEYIDLSTIPLHTLKGSQLYGICNRETMKTYIDYQQNDFKCCDSMYIFIKKSYGLIPPLAVDPYDIYNTHYKNMIKYIK